MTYSIYLGTNIVYSCVPVSRLKSILYSLQNELDQDLEDWFIFQNETKLIRSANNLGFMDFSKSKPFDNLPSLKAKIFEIENS